MLSLVTGATGLALPLVARQLIDNLAVGRPVTAALLVMTALVVANAGDRRDRAPTCCAARRSRSCSTARRGLVGRLLRLRLSAVESAEPGDLMSRVTADTTLLREVITSSLVGGVTGVLTLVATVALMVWLDLVLVAVTVGALVVAGVIIGFVVPRINRAARHAQEAVGVMGAALERMFGAFRTVKASGAEAREGERLATPPPQAWRPSVRAAKWTALAGNTAGLAVAGRLHRRAELRRRAGRLRRDRREHAGRVPALRLLSHGADRPARPGGHAVPGRARPRSPGSRRPQRLPVEPAGEPAGLPAPGTAAGVGGLRGRALPVPAGAAGGAPRGHASTCRRAA